MVRCDQCGFLCVRNLKSRELSEAEAEIRRDWIFPPYSADKQIYEEFPLCFARAADLREEAKGTRPALVLPVIQRERGHECQRFTPWQHGFTPKEHMEMLNALELRKWQDEQRERDRRWQEEQRQKERQWQEAQNRSNRNWQLIVALISVLVGAAIGYFMRTL